MLRLNSTHCTSFDLSKPIYNPLTQLSNVIENSNFWFCLYKKEQVEKGNNALCPIVFQHNNQQC